jgi:hypothetical protein
MKYISYIFLVVILFSCTENSNVPEKEKLKPALIIAVENSDGLLNSEYDSYIQQYNDEFKQIFSDLFGIDNNDIHGKSLNDIIEIYGEEWQINSIVEASQSKYDTIITLTDEEVDFADFVNISKELSESGYFIDLVFCLHGYETGILFGYDDINISEFVNIIDKNNIHIRSLYQTCCYAKHHLDDWESIGVKAVNGASGENVITMFSPQYFMQNWTNGDNFEHSVMKAKEMEIEKLRSFETIIPEISLLTDFVSLDGSEQFFSGKDVKLKWHEFLNAPDLP